MSDPAPPAFGGCEHPQIIPNVQTWAHRDIDGVAETIITAHVTIMCAVCHCRFQFLGNNELAPLSVQDAQQDRIGAWVSRDLSELACVIAPIQGGGGLAEVAVAGRA